jgi:hypothetical protein
MQRLLGTAIAASEASSIRKAFLRLALLIPWHHESICAEARLDRC